MDSKNLDYQSTLDWLFRQLPMFSRVGAAAYKPGLETSQKLDAYFNHPHRSYRTIHIAGTNGKGSCSHMIASILQASGYKTGLYTSPHLVDFRERIRVNGEMISKKGVIDFIERFRKSDYDGKPSFFELTMMMALDWFRKEEVDVAVIEVGMGGRLDSTNIINPEACIITNISFDHTQFLGNTLSQIAAEKSGIIKPGIPIVIGEAEGEVRRVFISKANEEKAEITFAEDEDLLLSHTERENELHCCSVEDGDFICPLTGDYQIKNLATVLSAVKMLRNVGFKIPSTAVGTGIQNVEKATGLRGRWSQLSDNPLVICDTGHNKAGLDYNFSKLERLLKKRHKAQLRMIVGFVADKDIESILKLFPTDAIYYLTNAAIPRALPVDKLAEKCNAIGINGATFESVGEAWEKANSDASKDDIIYIGGSTFIVADLFAYLESK